MVDSNEHARLKLSKVLPHSIDTEQYTSMLNTGKIQTYFDPEYFLGINRLS